MLADRSALGFTGMTVTEVLVLGATSLVGTSTVRELRSRGHKVIAVSRRPVVSHDPLVRWVGGDASVLGGLDSLPHCTQAISALPIWLTADAAPMLVLRGLRRMVAFSSSSATTKANAADKGERDLAARLVTGEQTIFSLGPGLRATVLRPTMIYGGPGDANIERIAGQLRRFRVFPLVGKGIGLRQPVHAADLGLAAVSALSSSASEGVTYTVAGGEALTVRRMVKRVGAANRVGVLFVDIPLRPAERALRALASVPAFRRVPAGALERLAADLVFDNTPATLDFGYQPRAFEPPDYRTAR